MNFIKYGDYNFHGNSDRYGKDGLFMEGQVEQRVALFGHELTADSLTFVVNSRKCAGENYGYAFLLDVLNRPLKTSDGKYIIAKNVFPDYRNYTIGTPLDLYNEPNGEIIGRFYVEDVTQVSRKTVKFTCTDAIGMLAKMEDYGGGVWAGASYINAGVLIANIMAGSGVTFRTDSDVYNTRVHGRLKRENRRLALGHILEAIGATAIEEKGVLTFVFLGGGSVKTVSRDDIYLGSGSVQKQTPATKVQVTEHNFYQLQSDETVTLFDNNEEGIAADNQLVVFNEPCYDLKWEGGSLPAGWENGANYCYVTGIGTLTGKAYTHTTRIVERSTGVNGTENIVSVEDNELVTIYNSAALAQRMVKYYKLPMSIDYEQLDATGKLAVGTPVNITDPFGTARSGWIRHKSFPIGNKTKAKMNVLVDWEGGPYGGSYNAFREFRASDITNGTLAIPAAMQGKDALIFLIGGGGGGQAGFDGEDGHNVTGTITNTRLGEPAMGGEGGEPGAPGTRPYYYSFQVASLPASFTGAAVGAGGAAGVTNGELGQEGGATTLNGNSSIDGERATTYLVNLVNGKRYCLGNEYGVYGGDGGIGSGYGNVGENTSTDGDMCIGNRGGHYSNGMLWNLGAPYRTFASAGAGGGGAAYEVDGYDGFSGTTGTTTYGAIGGDGADALIPFIVTQDTQAGAGGNGGGGGGGASAGTWQEQGSSTRHDDRGTGGKGGKGSRGRNGGDGLIVIYYNA